jgi:hypothetical protein
MYTHFVFGYYHDIGRARFWAGDWRALLTLIDGGAGGGPAAPQPARPSVPEGGYDMVLSADTLYRQECE